MKFGAYILTGGESRRMGNPKGLLEYKGQYFVDHIAHTFNSLSIECVLVGKPEVYGHLTYRIIEDIYTDKGPIGGIYTALLDSDYEHNFIIGCDTPLIKEDLIKSMLHNYNSELAVMCKTGEQVHPLVGIYQKTLLPIIKDHIDSGILKITSVIKDPAYFNCSKQLVEQLKNINTPEDLEALNK